MSYKTEYRMNWEGESPTIEEVAAYAIDGIPASSPEYRDHHRRWEQRVLGGAWEEWYEHQLDMAKISRNWPDTRFELRMDGDNPGDVCLEYHLNGQVQMVQRNRPSRTSTRGCWWNRECRTPTESLVTSG